MKQYQVTGMSCAACSARVEKAVSQVPGVASCSVSLLTNSMGVEGDAAPAEIIAAVEAAGYGAAEKGAAAKKSGAAGAGEALTDRETPALKRRLLWSLGLLLVLMYCSMGHTLSLIHISCANAASWMAWRICVILPTAWKKPACLPWKTVL